MLAQSLRNCSAAIRISRTYIQMLAQLPRIHVVRVTAADIRSAQPPGQHCSTHWKVTAIFGLKDKNLCEYDVSPG